MKNFPLRRSMAFLTDMGIISSLVAVVKNFLPITILIRNVEISGMAFTMGITLMPVFYGVYFIAFDLVNNGQTIGKILLGILVVSKDGAALSLKKHIRRSLYKMLSVLLLPVAVVLFLFRDYTLQDRYTNTKTRIARM